MATYGETVTENADFSAAQIYDGTFSLSFVQYINYNSVQEEDFPAFFNETINISDAWSSYISLVIYEVMLASEELGLTGTQTVSLSEDIKVKLIHKIVEEVFLNENLDLTHIDSEVIHAYAVAIELVNLIHSDLTQWEASAIVTDALAIASIISLIAPEDIVESLDITHISSVIARVYNSEIENLNVSQSYTTNIRFFSIVEEDFQIDESLDLANILSVLNTESIVFSTSYDDPTPIEAFILNPENTAVSTYEKYEFTGAVEFTNIYLFGNSTGLYKQEGTTDDGSYITGKIKTPSMDFGTSNKKNMPQVYLGVDNDSKLIMRCSVDGNNTAYYQLNLQSQYLDTQYIKLGKGLVGRYWQFEIQTKENEGLDIDTIEFYPITFGRKR